MRLDFNLKLVMPFLSSFGDYSSEPKKAPKDPEKDLYKNRIYYATGHCLRQWGISFKERNLLLFAIISLEIRVLDDKYDTLLDYILLLLKGESFNIQQPSHIIKLREIAPSAT